MSRHHGWLLLDSWILWEDLERVCWGIWCFWEGIDGSFHQHIIVLVFWFFVLWILCWGRLELSFVQFNWSQFVGMHLVLRCHWPICVLLHLRVCLKDLLDNRSHLLGSWWIRCIFWSTDLWERIVLLFVLRRIGNLFGCSCFVCKILSSLYLFFSLFVNGLIFQLVRTFFRILCILCFLVLSYFCLVSLAFLRLWIFFRYCGN